MDLSAYLIPQNHLINVCKYRMGSGCCRFILYSLEVDDFFCAKKIEELNAKITEQVPTMKAQGDNCSGLPLE